MSWNQNPSRRGNHLQHMVESQRSIGFQSSRTRYASRLFENEAVIIDLPKPTPSQKAEEKRPGRDQILVELSKMIIRLDKRLGHAKKPPELVRADLIGEGVELSKEAKSVRSVLESVDSMPSDPSTFDSALIKASQMCALLRIMLVGLGDR